MNAVLHSERRSAQRVPYALPVMIVNCDSAWIAQLIDLSEGGCGIFRPKDFHLIPDDLVRLFFYQDMGAAVVVVPARVARVTDGRVGIEYHDPQTIPPTRPTQ